MNRLWKKRKPKRMYRVYDFRCGEGHVFEKFVKPEITVCRCDCGSEATKLVSAPRCHLEGASGDFPGAHMKWVREHEKAGRKR